MRFASDFHWWLRHSWKSLASRLTRDPKIVIHGNSCIILYILHGWSGWSWDHITARMLGHCVAVCCLATLWTHWGRVTHICVSKLTIIGSDNGLSPGQCQAIIWTNAGILLIRPLATNFSEILIKIYTFSFKKIHLIMSYGNDGHFVSASMS